MIGILARLAPFTATDALVYSARSAIVVVFVIVAFRVSGKRTMAQLNLYDLAMIMALSNAVQNAMTGGRGNLGVGLCSSGAVLLVAWTATRISLRSDRAERRLVGSPTLLAHDGVLLRGRLRRERVTEDEFLAAVRQHGLDDIDQVLLGVLEVDGSISIVGRPGPAPTDPGTAEP